jgi:hypothetical protein
MMRIISASLTLHDTKIRIEQIIVFRTGYGTQNTIEFLGIWECLNNPDFNPIEFDGFKKTVRVCWQFSLVGITILNDSIQTKKCNPELLSSDRPIEFSAWC